MLNLFDFFISNKYYEKNMISINKRYYPKYQPKSTKFRDTNGEYHNPNWAAVIKWHPNGQLYCKEYYNHGLLHNINGPAVSAWYENGNLLCEEYLINGEYHNDKGFSSIIYYENGNIKSTSKHINGELLEYKEYKEYKE